MSKKLLTILYPGFAEWEVVFPLFCIHPAVQPVYVSLDEHRVRGAMGFEMETERWMAEVDPEEFDGVLLPGGMDPDTGRFPRRLGSNAGLLEILQGFDRPEKAVAAICGAPLVLGAAGLLRERRFTCDIEDDTQRWFDEAHRVDGTWVLDGHILTASVRGLVPFSIALAQIHGEEETARQIAEAFNLEIPTKYSA